MNAVRPFLIIALGASAVTFGCDRSPTGASQSPALTPLGDAIAPPSLGIPGLSCSALPATSVTKGIGRAGGSITFGPHTLRVPSGALPKTVSITAVIPTYGQGHNEVRFYPDGLRFRTPAYVTISYANCQLSAELQAQLSYMKIVYMRDGRIEEYVPTVHDAAARTLTGAITHFSNYAIAW